MAKPNNRWDGKSGKLNPWIDRRESRRTSIRVYGKDIPFDERCVGAEPLFKSRTDRGKPQDPRTPEQVYNYKSRYARYLRALGLVPSTISEEDEQGCIVYQFHSCDSITGYWQVKVCPAGATFLEAGGSLLILCPPQGGYQINQVQSDGTVFVWEQIGGSRTVLFEDATVKNPKIFILSNCQPGTGCQSGSLEPILLRVYPAGQPELADGLIIFTRPTDFYNLPLNLSVVTDNDKNYATCQLSSFRFVPQYLQKGEWVVSTPVGVTFISPTCDTQYITRYVIKEYIGNAYVEIDSVDADEFLFTTIPPNRYLTLCVEYNYNGAIVEACTPYYYLDTTNNSLVLGHDTYTNSLALTDVTSQETQIDLRVKNVIDTDDYLLSLGISNVINQETQLDLKVKAVIDTDDYLEPVSLSGVTTGNLLQVDLGGIIIG